MQNHLLCSFSRKSDWNLICNFVGRCANVASCSGLPEKKVPTIHYHCFLFSFHEPNFCCHISVKWILASYALKRTIRLKWSSRGKLVWIPRALEHHGNHFTTRCTICLKLTRYGSSFYRCLLLIKTISQRKFDFACSLNKLKRKNLRQIRKPNSIIPCSRNWKTELDRDEEVAPFTLLEIYWDENWCTSK